MGTIEENISHDHGAYCQQHPLAKLPDELFQGVVKYMSPRSFLNLKQTNKSMYRRCSTYESSVILWLDKVKINVGLIFTVNNIIQPNNTVQYFIKGEPVGSDAFLDTKFKLLIDTVQVHNLGNPEATLLTNLLQGKEIRAGQLYVAQAIHCSSRLFKEVVMKYAICKIVCSSMIPRLQTDETLQRILIFISECRQLLEWKNGLLLKNKFEVLHLVGYFFTPQTIHKVLKELVEGKRHINSWCLEKCYFEEFEPEKIPKILFRTWKMIKPEHEAEYIAGRRRPYVVVEDEFNFRLVCINGFEFIVNTACGVLIERKFPNENDEMVEDEEE